MTNTPAVAPTTPPGGRYAAVPGGRFAAVPSGSHAAVPGGRYAAVLTDLDGVLVDSGPLIETVWRAWATAHGIDADTLLAVVHGRLARSVIAEFAPQLDADAEAAAMDSTERARSSELAAVPGSPDVIALAQAHRWAIVTSGVAGLAASRIAAVGIPAPEVLVTADDVRRGKPDPEPYLLAARRLGVEPAACVVIEDAPAGVAAGRAAGMTVLAVTTTHAAAALGEADGVYSSMGEVAARLRELFAGR